MAVEKHSPSAPCICGSGQTFGRCCGRDADGTRYTARIRVTDVEPTRFLLVDYEANRAAMDAKGRVMVFSSRPLSMRLHDRLQRRRVLKSKQILGSQGMGEANWNKLKAQLFKAGVDFVLVETDEDADRLYHHLG